MVYSLLHGAGNLIRATASYAIRPASYAELFSLLQGRKQGRFEKRRPAFDRDAEKLGNCERAAVKQGKRRE
jgi:hypothetical protein